MIHTHLKRDWETVLWFSQLLFFIGATVSLVIAMIDGIELATTLWYYLFISLALLLVGSLNIIFFENPARYIVSMVLSMVNVVVVPLFFYATKQTLSVSVGVGLVYVMVAVAICPRLVGGGVLLASLLFASSVYTNNELFEEFASFRYDLTPMEQTATDDDGAKPKSGSKAKESEFHEYKVERQGVTLKEIARKYYKDASEEHIDGLLEANKSNGVLESTDIDAEIPMGRVILVPRHKKIDYAAYAKIAFWYAAAALVGFCWRLLVQRLYQLYMIALTKNSKKDSGPDPVQQEELDRVKSECQLLKEELSLHIIEMNQIVASKQKTS